MQKCIVMWPWKIMGRCMLREWENCTLSTTIFSYQFVSKCIFWKVLNMIFTALILFATDYILSETIPYNFLDDRAPAMYSNKTLPWKPDELVG